MTMNFGRAAEVAADSWLDWLVQVVEPGAAGDGSDDVPHTTTIRRFLERIKAASLAAGATQHYALIVSSGGVETEWDLLNADNLAPALAQRLNPESGTEGDWVRVAAGGRSYEVSAIPDATRTASGLFTASEKIKLEGVNLSRQVAGGGTPGQVYTKRTAADYDGYWATPAAGSSTTTLTGSYVSDTDLDSTAEMIIPEPSTSATWSGWFDLLTYTAAAGGRHIITGQLSGDIQATRDSSTWFDIVPAGGGDRVSAEVRLLYQVGDDLGMVFNYVRNVPQMADTNMVLDLLTSQVTAVAGATIKIQARYQQQLVGAQGSSGAVPPNDRTAARLRFAAGDVTLRITNLGELHPNNLPPPTHQVYIVVEDTASDVPTDTELRGTAYKSTTGSVAISDRPATQTTVYLYVWSAAQLTSWTFDNVGLPTPTNQIAEFTEGRRTLDSVNGWTYTGYDVYSEVLNTTIRWR